MQCKTSSFCILHRLRSSSIHQLIFRLVFVLSLFGCLFVCLFRYSRRRQVLLQTHSALSLPPSHQLNSDLPIFHKLQCISVYNGRRDPKKWEDVLTKRHHTELHKLCQRRDPPPPQTLPPCDESPDMPQLQWCIIFNPSLSPSFRISNV